MCVCAFLVVYANISVYVCDAHNTTISQMEAYEAGWNSLSRVIQSVCALHIRYGGGAPRRTEQNVKHFPFCFFVFVLF